MNRKITYSILALIFATLACNKVVGAPPVPSMPIPTGTTDLSNLTQPRVKAVLWNFAYSANSSPMADMYGDFPYTHMPSNANILAVSFFLELPEGWPEHKTELRTQWFRNGVAVQGSEGSLVCTQQEPCKFYTSRRYSSTGFEDGHHEVRLYLGNELLDGIEAKVELISTEWVRDLYMLLCDDATSDLCSKPENRPDIFSKHAKFPAGTQSVKIANAYAMLASGAGWQVDLYRDDRLIASGTQSVTGEGHWSGWRVTTLAAPGGGFERGLYFVKLTWKGVVVETISFEVQ